MPEGEGEELDVSAERCRVVKVTTVNKVQDADKEAWVLHDVPSNAEAACNSSALRGELPPSLQGRTHVGGAAVQVGPGPPAGSGAPQWHTRADELLRTLTKLPHKAQPFMQVRCPPPLTAVASSTVRQEGDKGGGGS